jgi:hypothetical protein
LLGEKYQSKPKQKGGDSIALKPRSWIDRLLNTGTPELCLGTLSRAYKRTWGMCLGCSQEKLGDVHDIRTFAPSQPKDRISPAVAESYGAGAPQRRKVRKDYVLAAGRRGRLPKKRALLKQGSLV